MKGIKVLLLVFGFSFCISAQNDTSFITRSKPSVLKKMGKGALRQNDPGTAAVYLKAGAKKEPGDAEMLNLLGSAYLKMRDYENARVSFLRAWKTNPAKAPEALYYHALMQKSSGQYDSARLAFQQFRKAYKGPNKILKRLAKKEAEFCDSVTRILGNHQRVVVTHLDTSVNKVNTEAAPVLLNENTLLYSSLRTETVEYEGLDTGITKTRRLYIARKEDTRWKYSTPFKGLSIGDKEASNAALSPDGKRLYLSLCRRNAAGEMMCALYVCWKESNGWSEPQKLPKEVNFPRSSCTMPCVTSDPLKGYDIVYFASNSRKGKGGFDIWYTTYDAKKNMFKPARNAGSKINTPSDELTPFYDAETRQLYFSSEGHGSLGGFDVFAGRGQGGKWAGVVNIGSGINSGADELYYTISPERNEGFFVSNRKGGNALKHRTCCDDIYTYLVPNYKKVQISGTVEDVLDDVQALANATVDVYVRDTITNERSFVRSVVTNSAGVYKTTLEPDQEYEMVIRKQDYLGIPETVSTRNMDSVIVKKVKLMKKPRSPLEVPNFNYEFNSDQLSPRQKKIVDSMIVSMMEINPELIIEIRSHTDSRGSESYNMRLSQRRAENLVQYLIAHNISPARLRAAGFGETEPVAPNENANGSDNPEGRARNRRTEVKIVGTIDTSEPVDEMEAE